MGCDSKEDSTALLFDHSLSHIQCQEGCTLQHNIQNGLKGISRETLRWGNEVSSRIVNNHSREAKFLFNLVHSYFNCFWVSNIQLNWKDGASSSSLDLRGSSFKSRQIRLGNLHDRLVLSPPL